MSCPAEHLQGPVPGVDCADAGLGWRGQALLVPVIGFARLLEHGAGPGWVVTATASVLT